MSTHELTLKYAGLLDTLPVQATGRWGLVKSDDGLIFFEELWQFPARSARVLIPLDLNGQEGCDLPQCAGAHPI